ncbi:MAG: CarD family transcriptional regulator [Spirochaetaceae bacterium]|nr:MAG: CarD family transcriptional regulator [Spirochaetaceae bacterium]
MPKLPVLCRDEEVRDRIQKICERFQSVYDPSFYTDSGEFLESLRYDLPEAAIINFSDQLEDATQVLGTIHGDPWLHYGGIVGVCRQRDEHRVQELLSGSNVISLIRRGEFVSHFSRVIRILVHNRQILFQRDIQKYLLQDISGSFVMDSDPFNARTYTNLVTNYLYNSNYIDRDGRDRLHVALFELLMNAIEHGNCGISYEEKNAWLGEGRDILYLIREKMATPEIRDRRVHFSYRISDDRSVFRIRDEGAGFDWRARIADTAPKLESHGHGLRMTGAYVDNLRYNDAGNEVMFDFVHKTREANAVPGLFSESEERVVQPGDVVFREGEESDYLYYIASGELGIYTGESRITTLSPDDIFLGEMSFLLNNRRSATVIAESRSLLIRISKNRFVSVIKEKPHYGIFLARLVAQRLERLNRSYAQLQQSI